MKRTSGEELKDPETVYFQEVKGREKFIYLNFSIFIG